MSTFITFVDSKYRLQIQNQRVLMRLGINFHAKWSIFQKNLKIDWSSGFIHKVRNFFKACRHV